MTIPKYLLIASGLLWVVSCADTEQYIEQPDPVVRPTYAEAMAQWEAMLPSSAFIDAVEVVPTDTLQPYYDDYIENSEFKNGRIITLQWQGDHVTVDNPQADKGVKVIVSGTRVVIENLESQLDADDARGKVTYRLQGTSSDGQFKVYSDKKFQLQLDGLQLTCADGPAISIQTKKRCFVVCTEGSDNHLADGATYASDAVADPQEDEKGCLFSEGQLIFYGPGQLSVTGHHQHAIASDEYIVMHSGCHVTVLDAVKDGIHAKEQYHQIGGMVRSYASKDALQTDTLGIQLQGGYLYLCGSNAYKTDGNGTLTQTQGQLAPISWNPSADSD